MLANDGLIQCLDCEFIASETECQVLDKRGDYLKCPKCGATDDRLTDIIKPTTTAKLLDEIDRLKSQKAALLAACKSAESYLQGVKSGQIFEESDIVGILQSAIKAGEGAK